MVKNILKCFQDRYSKIYDENEHIEMNSERDGDHVLLDVCHILNTNVWPELSETEENDEDNLSVPLLPVQRIFE